MPQQYISVLDQLEMEGFRAGVQTGTKKAIDWFKKRAQQLSGVDRQDMLKDQTRIAKTFTIGKMYMYVYDPKFKLTLPYYDVFPLIFAVNTHQKGWYGVNLHYLHPDARARLLDALSAISNNNAYNETTKLNLSYKILKGSSKYKEFVPCFKKYLSGHVRSKLLQIEAYDWAPAVFLPVASFKKKSAQHVWTQSKQIIKSI